MTSSALITYVRVSTSQQGRSGLGLEAQRQALRLFATAEGLEVTHEFVEVETGKGKAALAAAKKLRCPVAVSTASVVTLHFINVLPIIKEAQRAGAHTLRAVAEALNARVSQQHTVARGTP